MKDGGGGMDGITNISIKHIMKYREETLVETHQVISATLILSTGEKAA